MYECGSGAAAAAAAERTSASNLRYQHGSEKKHRRAKTGLMMIAWAFQIPRGGLVCQVTSSTRDTETALSNRWLVFCMCQRAHKTFVSL